MFLFRPIWNDPIATELNDDILYSVPPPGSGVLLGFILNILKGYNFTSDNIIGINNTVFTYHKIIESFKYAYAKRTELADPTFNNITEVKIKNLILFPFLYEDKLLYYSIFVFSLYQI